MKILVTGAAGFLGSALVARLAARGTDEIRCLLRHRRAAGPLDKIEYVFGSLTTPADAQRAVEGVDLILHLAAALKGAPADIFWNTVVGSKNLLESLRPSQARIVLVSSFGVYGVAGLPARSVIDERTPLETHPELRDAYSYAKLRQEQLFREYCQKLGLDLRIVRPGVLYGPGGNTFHGRLGLKLAGLLLNLGRDNLLPLSYLDNCAEAILSVAMKDGIEGQVYNVHDDDLPTASEYLRQYRQQVGPIRSVPLPYSLLLLLSQAVEAYHRHSQGQLPAILTPYKVATTWKYHRFDNRKLKGIGWKQLVPTGEGMRRTFEALRSCAA